MPTTSRRRRRLTYANVMSTVAVLLAIGGGTAYALTVTSADIVDGAVQSADLQDRGILGIDVALGALGSEHVRQGTLTTGDMSAPTRRQVDEVLATGVVLSDADGRGVDGGPSAAPGLLAGSSYRLASVTRPNIGQYCVRVATGAYDPARGDIVLTTVEWGSSAGSQLHAFWNRAGSVCAAGRVEIRTRNSETGVATNNVSFSLAVLRGPG